MNVKLQKTAFVPNLTGAALFAFGVLQSKLTNAISTAIGRSTWDCAKEQIAAVTDGLDTENALAAVEKFYKDTISALHGKAVAEAIEAAGYGGVQGVAWDENGKQSLGKDAKHITALFGAKFKLKAQLDRSTTTIKQYCDNIANAIRLNVDYSEMTVGELTRANRDAAEKAKPELAAKREEQQTARNVGATARDMYLSGDEALRDTIFNFNAIMDAWMLATPERRAEVRDIIGEIGLEFQTLKDEHDAAEAAKAEEASKSENGADVLPNVNGEAGDESIHAERAAA